jgi:hypothetical protein
MHPEFIFAGLPAGIWLVLRVILPNKTFDFDWDAQHATFMLLIDKFLVIAGSIAVIGMMLALYDAHRSLPLVVTGSCLAAALYAFLFILHLVTSYQTYLHHRYQRSGMLGPSTYTTAKYALTNALGWSAVVFFIYGVVGSVRP